MALEVRYDSKLDIVETVLSGVVTPEELREETVQAATFANANNCDSFLSDCTEAVFKFSTVDVYDLPSIQDEEGVPRSSQIAVVTPTSERGRGLAQFYETVCLNRGWKTRVFTDRAEALAWLLDQDRTT